MPAPQGKTYVNAQTRGLLRLKMRDLGVTDAYLAAQLGMQPAHIRNLIRGSANMSRVHLLAMRMVLVEVANGSLNPTREDTFSD